MHQGSLHQNSFSCRLTAGPHLGSRELGPSLCQLALQRALLCPQPVCRLAAVAQLCQHSLQTARIMKDMARGRSTQWLWQQTLEPVASLWHAVRCHAETADTPDGPGLRMTPAPRLACRQVLCQMLKPAGPSRPRAERLSMPLMEPGMACRPGDCAARCLWLPLQPPRPSDRSPAGQHAPEQLPGRPANAYWLIVRQKSREAAACCAACACQQLCKASSGLTEQADMVPELASAQQSKPAWSWQ